MPAHLGSAGEVIMVEQIFGGPSLRQILLALSIFVVFIGLAWLFHVFLVRAARRLAQKTKTKLGDAIISVLEKPVVVILVLTGLYLSVRFLPLEAVLCRQRTCRRPRVGATYLEGTTSTEGG
jgi:hypothetical protein